MSDKGINRVMTYINCRSALIDYHVELQKKITVEVEQYTLDFIDRINKLCILLCNEKDDLVLMNFVCSL